jgi:hypothetical protein
MKQYRPILSLAFAILVLFSSSNVMVGLHICSGRVQNFALFSKADGCAMEKLMPPCHKQESKPCCQDETIIHDSADFSAPAADISISPLLAVDMELPLVLISEVIPSAPTSTAGLYNYDPPLRSADLTVSFQVFLI